MFGQSLEEDLRAINAMYAPDTKHQVSNDISGEAIKQMVQQGDTSNFQYSDNLARAIRLTGKILVSIIPLVYSEKRVTRIIGLDDSHKLVTVNAKPGEPVQTPDNEDEESGIPKVFDLTTGKFDVTLSAGPSYQSQREASRNLLWTLAGKDPTLMQRAGDLIVSMNDDPAMKPLAERLNKILVAGNPALADNPKNGKSNPQALQAQLDEAHQMLQAVTAQLEAETKLADKIQADADAKIKVEQIKQQTALQREALQEHHETNKIDFEANLADLRAEQTRSHEMLMQIHKHLMAKDLAEHQANLQAIMQPAPEAPAPENQNIPQ